MFISALWDPANAGRVGLRDDSVEAVSFAALALGQAPNNPSDLDAHKFITFMVSPDFHVRWDTDVGAPAFANGTANAQLPADAFNRLVLGDAETVSRLHFMVPLSDEQREKTSGSLARSQN